MTGGDRAAGRGVEPRPLHTYRETELDCKQDKYETRAHGARSVASAARWHLAAMAAGLFLSTAVTAAPQTSDYTAKQAADGAQVYTMHCSQCHGPELKGQAGPALAGPTFKDNLEFSKMSAAQLLDFISKQMPANEPGSLQPQQYLDVVAFILSKNGYPEGGDALTDESIKNVKLLPYPGTSP